MERQGCTLAPKSMRQPIPYCYSIHNHQRAFDYSNFPFHTPCKEEKGGLNTPKNRRITRRSKSEQSETDLSLDIKFKLSNGVTITGLGFGTVANECTKGESYAAALHTLGTGHRHLDCAWFYLNEDERKINNVKGPDIWVTTKVWNHLYDKDGVQWSLNDSLKKLNLDYVGLFLIHWPISCEMPTTGEKVVEDPTLKVIAKECGHTASPGVAQVCEPGSY
ncbi:hypothetical protein I7I51_05464 [Histoplasma capsulatum]|uniref:NADP-dependent oxidoreductase domain-containing protein n=1 Tax=Ajellomyces capsulatus TaxID=5037 RepID=A0A8A1M7G1_AJECA|nr:hypothetical protein I7I51_05464 [Histoplasma capsulatum]